MAPRLAVIAVCNWLRGEGWTFTSSWGQRHRFDKPDGSWVVVGPKQTWFCREEKGQTCVEGVPTMEVAQQIKRKLQRRAALATGNQQTATAP